MSTGSVSRRPALCQCSWRCTGLEVILEWLLPFGGREDRLSGGPKLGTIAGNDELGTALAVGDKVAYEALALGPYTHVVNHREDRKRALWPVPDQVFNKKIVYTMMLCVHASSLGVVSLGCGSGRPLPVTLAFQAAVSNAGTWSFGSGCAHVQPLLLVSIFAGKVEFPPVAASTAAVPFGGRVVRRSWGEPPRANFQT